METERAGIARAFLSNGWAFPDHDAEINLEIRVPFTLFCLHQGLVIVGVTKRFNNACQDAAKHGGACPVSASNTPETVIPSLLIRQCKSSRRRKKIADSSGATATGGEFLTRTLVAIDLLKRHVLSADEKTVGLLLPPSVGGAVINAAITLSGRTAVNLNYTLSEEVVNYCIRESGLKHVLASRKFLEKRPMDLDVEVVCVEDLVPRAGWFLKVVSWLKANICPAWCLEQSLGLSDVKPDDLLTIIFTSGSTGEPKGAMLSHRNVSSNVAAVNQLFNLTADDTILGVLPFFHSFGYTGLLWLPLALEPTCVYHFNPLDGRMVGKLCEQHGVTMMLATPTFLRTYLKRCKPEQLKKLDLVVVGAEKMPIDLAKAFKDKFAVMPTEGFGTTELSPVVAANVPDHRAQASDGQGTRLGTVGKPLPGVRAKVVDPDSGEELGNNADGLLQIKGPNVMLGYLNQQEKTEEVIRDGWYDTGDIAQIDEDGFISITGRLSRFSKIGGEMVPHIKVEEHLAAIAESGEHSDEDDEVTIRLAVTSVPDVRKGERLIVLYTSLGMTVEEIVKKLGATELPKIWLPSADSYLKVDGIPLLGTGKLDLKAIQQMALESSGGNGD